MRGDESASAPTTPPLPIKTMFLASVTPSGPHSPRHLLTTAIQHTHAVQTSTPPLRAILLHCSKSYFRPRLLTPYVARGFGGERKATAS